jgi:manganese/iron transport system permease protein
MIDLELWGPVLVAACVVGASTGALGVYVVGMRMPFLGVCVSHAALAGAVMGLLGGLRGSAMLLPAWGGALATSLALGLADPRRFRIDLNVGIGVLFSLTMGVALLGLGLAKIHGLGDTEVYTLLSGSIALCRWRDVALLSGVAVALVAFLWAFGKEMGAILFSRFHAACAGVRVTLVWTGFLVLTSSVLTVNFPTVGGLLIYSLLANPAAAAFLLVRGQRDALWVSAALGAGCCVGGVLLALWLDVFAGPMIVILSALTVVVASVVGRGSVGGTDGER